MDQSGGATAPSNAALGNDAGVHLLNDVRFVLFPLLPAELRRAIWLLLLQQNRAIEMYLRDGYISEEDKLQRYTRRNHLGKIVSGRGYLLAIRGGGYAATLSPLLRVDSETRQLTLDFYRVHLPFRQGYDGERLLYLNPMYDRPLIEADDMSVCVLSDFLHDIKAHDPRNQGYAHSLELPRSVSVAYFEAQQVRTGTRPQSPPANQPPPGLVSHTTSRTPSHSQPQQPQRPQQRQQSPSFDHNAVAYNRDLNQADSDAQNNQPVGGEASGGDLGATLRQEMTERLQSNKNR